MRLALAAAALCASAAAQAVRTTPGSCPQLDYIRELPPMPADPRMVLNADHAELKQGGLSHLSGSVLISKDGYEFSARQLDFSDADKHVLVNSESYFRNPLIIVKSLHADFDLNAQTGSFDNASFTLLPLAARGTAEHLTLARAGWARMDRVSYTTCGPDNDGWILRAASVELDQDKGVGHAHDAAVWFQGVPLIYLPYLSFPTDGERHTGFLAPIVGNGNNTGFDVRAPYYLNLAPNYDATLIPRLMSRRGEQLGGQVRYLLPESEGTVYGEYMPHDYDTGTQRSFINLNTQSLLGPRLGLETAYASVSDRNYFQDLGGHVDLTEAAVLAQGAKLTYQAPTVYTLTALIQGYQPLAGGLQPVDNPYRRTPQIRLDALSKNSFLDTRAGFDGEFTNFARSNSVEGQRFVGQPYLRWERNSSSWFAAAQSDFSYSYYNLTNTPGGEARHPDRTLPLYSAEGGLHFDRITGSGELQTLEPHVYYLYVPYHNQDQLPVFDTGEPDFDLPELFARNRFTGQDRIADANQVTSALTTRLIDPNTGESRLSASFGEIYRTRASRVSLPGFETPSAGSSDYIAAGDYQLSRRWALAGLAEVTSTLDRFSRTEAELRYREPDAGTYGNRFDLAYRYFNGLLQQVDTAASTPISDRWRLAGRLRYSVADDRMLDSFGGLEYQTCCWAARATYRRFLTSNAGTYNNGVYFQIELKGLSRLGSGFEDLLPAIDPNAPIRGRNAAAVVP
ncbi:MAG: LPS-assembly protein LptD [Nevskia sp.]|nr:LPS-assembly protein LptD [Nevskia sp.]